MDAQILLDNARIASQNHSGDSRDRLAFRVGYLEQTIKQLVNLLEDTEEIIARPYEKFFNLGTSGMPETEIGAVPSEPDILYEKMDGFLCTLYSWEGVEYMASKGSFDSPHAKWATAQYRKQKVGDAWLPGWTPVFEGLTKNRRIVVDYGGREELVLTGVVHIETGEQFGGTLLQLAGSY